MGFPGDGFLDLLSGAGVMASGVPGLPVGVFLAIAGDGFLSDAAGSGSGFSCHFVLAFPGQICYDKWVDCPYRERWLVFYTAAQELPLLGGFLFWENPKRLGRTHPELPLRVGFSFLNQGLPGFVLEAAA